MRLRIYGFLVNRHPGISERYHKFHDGSSSLKSFISWVYLLWLNFAYYCLFCRFLGKKKGIELYESQKLIYGKSESRVHKEEYSYLTVEYFVDKLLLYDVISFDIFDTLIFRPFSDPKDLFYIVGEGLEFMDFKSIRTMAEKEARERRHAEFGDYEVSLEEIWERLSVLTGLDPVIGKAEEIKTERNLCYANPFMLEVFNELKKRGKKLIVTSDMYLSEELLCNLLERNGFSGFERIYVSNKYRKSKAEGSLYRLVKKENNGRIVHVGDNLVSDVRNAEANGIDTLYYPNINRKAQLIRPYDMSPMVGGAYRGIVDNCIYGSGKEFSREYEYGFIYGGLFVLGYCNFIHKYCVNNGIDTLLFLSRDGSILKEVYDKLFPGENTKYAYWSRKAALKQTADINRYDYYRRFIDHRISDRITIGEALESMGLLENSKMKAELSESKIKLEGLLNVEAAEMLKQFLDTHIYWIEGSYFKEKEACQKYYENLLCDSKKCVAIDIGWAGSGAVALRNLAKNSWELDCEIIGMVAGTNTIYNAEPDASESFLQSGKIVSYMYSQRDNRDLFKLHDPGKDYNIFWELLLSSTEPQCIGFGFDGEGNPAPVFGKKDFNSKGISEIRLGIIDFVEEYSRRFEKYPYMMNISGRDAYAPMIVAASHNEKYLKEIEKMFKPIVGV